jgi:hypothetical protein
MYKLIQYINEKWELNRGHVHPLKLVGLMGSTLLDCMFCLLLPLTSMCRVFTYYKPMMEYIYHVK